MLVLGADTTQVGRQLEVLTTGLLAKLGYTDLTLGFIGPGGYELDVTGEFPIPPVDGDPQNIRLICECKAQRGRVGTTAWMKFLGKLYFEKARLKREVRGYLIALSGVNGNVKGSFDELRERVDSVRLLYGADLDRRVADLHPHCGVTEARLSVERFSRRGVTEVELAYFESAVYHVVTFQDDSFTVLDAAGEPLRSGAKPVGLLEEKFSSGFADLHDEAQAVRRKYALQHHLAAELFLARAGSTVRTLHGAAVGSGELREAGCERLTADEIRAGLLELEDAGIVSHMRASWRLVGYPGETRGDFTALLKALRFMLPGGLPVRVLRSPRYAALFGQDLLAEIGEAQPGLNLAASEKAEVLQLLRLSPKALFYAIDPDPILKERSSGPQTKQLDELGRSHFKRTIYTLLELDYRQPALAGFYINDHALMELETRRGYTLKGKAGPLRSTEITLRHGLRFLEGGGAVPVLLLGSVPEPWDEEGLRAISVPPAKKTASKKAASKKTASKKTASKKTASKKTASKKTASRKTASKKTH